MLVAYPHPPTDRPRELATFLSTLDPLRAAVATAHQHQRPLLIHARPVTSTGTVRRPWHTPLIDDVGDLAAMLDLSIEHLDWYADRRAMNRRATAHRLHHYHYRWTDHGRLIEAPKSRLRALQRRLLTEVLGPIPVHPAAHGFVPGRSAHTFAAAHAAQPVVVRIDLLAFFTHIPATRVHGLFRTAGYPEPVAHSLTGLGTTRTPHPSSAAHPPTYRTGRPGSPRCAPATCPKARPPHPHWRTCAPTDSTDASPASPTPSTSPTPATPTTSPSPATSPPAASTT